MVELDAEYPDNHFAQSKGYASAEHIQAIKEQVYRLYIAYHFVAIS